MGNRAERPASTFSTSLKTQEQSFGSSGLNLHPSFPFGPWTSRQEMHTKTITSQHLWLHWSRLSHPPASNAAGEAYEVVRLNKNIPIFSGFPNPDGAKPVKKCHYCGKIDAYAWYRIRKTLTSFGYTIGTNECYEKKSVLAPFAYSFIIILDYNCYLAPSLLFILSKHPTLPSIETKSQLSSNHRQSQFLRRQLACHGSLAHITIRSTLCSASATC